MRLLYLNQTYTDAFEASGYKFDGTEALELTQEGLASALPAEDFLVVTAQSEYIASMSLFSRMGFKTDSVLDRTGKLSFDDVFPEYATKGEYALEAHIETLKVFSTPNGDIIICEQHMDDSPSFIEKVFKALGEQMTAENIMKLPVWQNYIGNTPS